MNRRRLNSLRLLLAVAVAAGAAALGQAQLLHADNAPPPDWDPNDWAALTPDDQTLERTDYDDGTGDPTAKAGWVGANSDAAIDSELDSSLGSEGASVDTPVGVNESPMSPFSRGTYVLQNHWQDPGASGTLIQVWSGSLVSEPCTGVLLINTIPWPPQSVIALGTVTVLEYPNQGPLFISEATGHLLSLVTAAGDRGSYNVDTGWERWIPIGRSPSDPECITYDGGYSGD